MRVLYARCGATNRLRAIHLPVDSIGALCALMNDDKLELCRFPPPHDAYVLIRPSQWRGRPLNRLVAYKLRWDLCFEGDCVVARLDGLDVPLDFDPFDGKYTPFSVYERMDLARRVPLLDEWRADDPALYDSLDDEPWTDTGSETVN